MDYNRAQGPLETSTGTIRKAQKGFRGEGFLTFLVFVKNITKIKNWLLHPHFWADFQVTYHLMHHFKCPPINEDFCGQESQLRMEIKCLLMCLYNIIEHHLHVCRRHSSSWRARGGAAEAGRDLCHLVCCRIRFPKVSFIVHI